MQELMPIIKFVRIILFLAITLFLSCEKLLAQADSATIRTYAQLVDTDTLPNNIFDEAVARAERILKIITIKNDKFDFAIYPAASYSGQSGLAIGVMPMFRKKSTDNQATVITPAALVSTKKMWEIQCDANIYFGCVNEIEAKLELFHQPDNYYGLASLFDGEKQATYHLYRYQLLATYKRSVGHHFYLGPTTDFSYHCFRNIKADTISIISEIDNSKGYANGLGGVFCFDTRDNHLYATQGWYSIVKFLSYQNFVGSKFKYNQLSADVRYYISVGIESVVAMQAYFCGIISGQAPYYKMPSFGGTRLGRAIPHSQKYADRYAWLYQAEMRYPMFWRIGGTVWTGVGNVAHNANKDLLHKVHGMLGMGFRFKVFSDKGLNVRLDGGISTHGDHAIYFNVREAF